MGCGSNPIGKREGSPEFDRQFKPENNSGCGQRNMPDCDSPSLAREGSALAEWEKIHGKLVSRYVKKIGEDGRFFMEVNRFGCGKPSTRKSRKTCCALKYRVVR